MKFIRKSRAIGIILAMAISATGCATAPIPTLEAVETSNLLAGSTRYLSANSETEVVVVKRDHAIVGAACRTRIFVDAVPVAELDVGEKVTLHLPRGSYVIGANTTGICGGGLSEVAAIVELGHPLAFRIGHQQGGHTEISPTAF